MSCGKPAGPPPGLNAPSTPAPTRWSRARRGRDGSRPLTAVPQAPARRLVRLRRTRAKTKRVAAVCRERGVSEQTYHRWRNQFGGLKADDAKRLKDLEQVRTWLRSDRALRTKPMAL
jgi:putative transposase